MESVTALLQNISTSEANLRDVKHRESVFSMRLLNMVISGFGVPGNLLVLVVIGNSPQMRHKIFNKFIFNQSLLDFGVCSTLFLRQVEKSIYIREVVLTINKNFI